MDVIWAIQEKARYLSPGGSDIPVNQPAGFFGIMMNIPFHSFV
jgi:hypothetical protein